MKKLFLILLLLAVLVVGIRIGSHNDFSIYLGSTGSEKYEITSEYSSWADHGMGQHLPDPSKVFDRWVDISDTYKNNDKKFIAIIKDVSEEEFRVYAEECKKYGFAKVKQERSHSFILQDGIIGNTLKIRFIGDELFININ